MRAWATSAINSYYRDPVIAFREAGYRDAGRSAVAVAGHYIVPHCDPDCCGAFGQLETLHLGPFDTFDLARQWSRTNLSTPVAADDDDD